MKKVLFAAIAVCGFVAANAQLSESKVSSATNTKADAVTGTFDLKLEVRNIIRIVPDDNYNLTAVFNSASSLDGGKDLSGPLGLPGVAFNVSSNRNFHVSMSTPSASVIGTDVAAGSVGNNNMPISVFQFRASAVTEGLTMTSNAWRTLATDQSLVSNGNYGALRILGIQFKANPGWSYEGGNYTVPMTVTATQD